MKRFSPERLRAKREEAGLSVRQVLHKFSMLDPTGDGTIAPSEGSYRNWERGTVTPNSAALFKLLSVWKCELADLVEETQP